MSNNQAEIRARITELEELLASGVSSISVDGTSTSFDLESARKELRRLRELLPEGRKRRPRSMRINLGGF